MFHGLTSNPPIKTFSNSSFARHGGTDDLFN
jgi:hypothetical protein